MVKDAYGIGDGVNTIYLGSERVYTHKKGDVDVEWDKPVLGHEVFTLAITADWTEKQCKLSFFYQEKKLNDTNDEYTLLLPELDDRYVWYPCVTPYNKDAYCIIHFM